MIQRGMHFSKIQPEYFACLSIGLTLFPLRIPDLRRCNKAGNAGCHPENPLESSVSPLPKDHPNPKRRYTCPGHEESLCFGQRSLPCSGDVGRVSPYPRIASSPLPFHRWSRHRQRSAPNLQDLEPGLNPPPLSAWGDDCTWG